MSDKSVFKEGKHNDFIQYLFSNDPHTVHSIQLELPIDDSNKNNGCLQVIPKQHHSLLNHSHNGVFQGKVTENVQKDK